MHDAAVTAWGIKGWYDYIRPISSLRAMADLGQSSDATLPSYHNDGILLEPGFIELVKADDYFVTHQETSEGEPLWTVYVLIKIAKENVDKHRVAIAEEAKRRANAPPPPDEWTASVFNIDDSVAISVNGKIINECEFARSCTIKLSPHFKSGPNKVRLEYSNRALFWTYGYEILKNDEVMYRDRCGQVWLFGCADWDTKRGVVHAFEFQVEKR